MTAGMIAVYDNFLPNPIAVREIALASEFTDFDDVGGITYKRVCMSKVPGFQESLELRVGAIDVHLMGYRLNYKGEMPNSRVHSDIGLGTHAAVLYLCEGEGGTAFWEHRETGMRRLDSSKSGLFERTKNDWDNGDAWVMCGAANLVFNRAVVYDSNLFHSRWPWDAFGDNPRNGRLVAVAFFTPNNKPIVRHAVDSDIPEILSLVREFYETTEYTKFAAMDDESVKALIYSGLQSKTAIVARIGTKLVGFAGALVIPFMFNRNVRTANEVAWWVTPPERTGRLAFDMLRALDKACASAGVVAVQLSHLPNSPQGVSDAYKRCGYTHSETCYTRLVK